MPAPVPYEDSELLLLMSSDDEQAFRLLYEKYWEKLLVHAFIKLNCYEDAEEIVQDAFVNLWRRRATLEINNSFYTYISAVVKYEILRRLALRKTNAEREAAVEQTYTEEDNSTIQWLDFNDLQQQIEATVKSLPEKCQLVFRLSREAGMTEKQIAKVMNIAPKTVEAHKSRALRTLRKLQQQFLSLFF